jgi:hypothetical protein
MYKKMCREKTLVLSDDCFNICMNSLTALTKCPAEFRICKQLHFSGKLDALKAKNYMCRIRKLLELFIAKIYSPYYLSGHVTRSL